jgi:2-oxoglutarate dehydrogenase E1 component
VIDDVVSRPERVRRVLLCSGKVYYDLIERKPPEEIAIVRVEQLYPFPEAGLRAALSKYRRAEVVWVQEESQNMGGWSFVEPRLKAMGYPVAYVGRDASASPAVGSLKIHQKEQAELVDAALNGGPVPHLVGTHRVPAAKVEPAADRQPAV